MAERDIFEAEHSLFRQTVRRFYETEVAPHHARWEAEGVVARDLWLKAGELGLLCVTVPEKWGGAGADRLYSTILLEEQGRSGLHGPGFSAHSDIVAPYLLRLGNDEQRERWLPPMARGQTIGAIAMTEPTAGSDLRGLRCTARRDGAGWRINGQKTFITNGQNADLVIVVAKTGETSDRHSLSLFVVETDQSGFTRGRNLDKVGLKAQDTSELFFEDVFVPEANLLGEEGKGFSYLSQELAWERLQIAIVAVASAQTVLEETVAYTRERMAFGRSILDNQNTRFELAEIKTDITIGRTFVDRCIVRILEGSLDAAEAAMAKWWCSDMQFRSIDRCLQLHGGYGYMREYPVARAWADARIQRIYGGTNEIMKEIIGRTL